MSRDMAVRVIPRGQPYPIAPEVAAHRQLDTLPGTAAG